PQLDDAAGPRGCDHSEVRVGDVLGYPLHLRMVERVEGFHAELQGRVPGEREVLEESQIQVVDAGPSQDAAAGVAELAQGGLCERRRVEQLLHRSAPGADVAHDVAAVGAEGVKDTAHVGREYRDGEASL